jgi:LuxR family maltose regulon positive regulatory protein
MSTPDPLIATKLYLPQPRGDIVPRPRLVEKLDSGLQGKVTVVSAPAGYGKTTLLSDWAQRIDQSVIWLSLDEKDNDLPRFLRYLLKAIQQIDRRIGKDVLDVLASPQSPPAEILLTLLINDIAASDQEFVLVLDDCHEITNFEIYKELEFFIEHQPPAIHIIFIGRLDPSITLSKLRVTGDLLEIRSADLRFTKMESTVFLNDSMDLDLSVDEIMTLEQSTEGWIAGLQLAGLSLQQRENKREFIHVFSGVHRHLFDYLMDEVLSNQPSAIREFLFQTSILDRFNDSLCDSILGIETSFQIIQELEAANLFIIPLDDERNWFRYHHLFGDFLEVCLQDNQPEKIPEIHKRAAKWYAEHNYASEAFKHLIQGEDYAAASFFLELKAKKMLEQSELATLLNWVAELPEQFVDQHPRLGIYHTWALRLSGSQYDIVESKIDKLTRYLEASEKDLSRLAAGSLYERLEDEYRNLLAHLFGLKAFQGIYSENPPLAIEMVEKAKKLKSDENFILSSLDFALGWAYRLSGDLEAAYLAFHNSSELSLRSGNLYMAVSTLCRGAFGQVLGGHLSKGEVEFQKALRLAHLKNGRQLPVAGYAYGYLSGINYEWNNLEVAKEYAFEGIKLSERVGLIYDQVIGYCYLARVFLAHGDVESAQDACDNAKDLSLLMGDYIYIRRWVEDSQVRIWTHQDNRERIERWVHSTDLRMFKMQ